MTKADSNPSCPEPRGHCIQKHLDIAGIAFLSLDTEGNIRLLNRSGHELLEYPDGELVGRNWFETCVPAAERTAGLARFRRLLAGDAQSVDCSEGRILTRSGQERIVHWHCNVLADESGKCVGVLSTGKDVTARRQAEESLWESERRFRNVVETCPDAIVLVDLKGRLLMANQRAALLFGFVGVDELLSGVACCFDLTAPEERQRTAREIQECVSSGGVTETEYWMLRRDGTRFPVQLHGSVQRDDEGNPKALIAVIRDITEQKLAEAALRESEERFRTIIETSPDAIVMMDLDGRLLMANQRAALLGGFACADELLSGATNAFNLLVPEDRQRALDNYAAILESDILPNREYCVLRQDGSRVPVEVSSSLLRDPGGRPKAVIMVIRDTSDRKRVEAALRRSEELYRSLVDNIDVGITLIDTEYNIVAINPAQARLFDRDMGSFPGKKCFREFERRDAVCAHCPGARAMATGRSAEAETEGVWDDGSRFPVRVKAFPMFAPDGAATGFIELVEDVTPYRRAQALAQQAREAAEAANRAKSEFLANMSHEIRTPLTAILGYADVLLGDATPSESRDAAETIKRNGEHLLQIISDILDISRIEAGRIEPEYTRCSPRRIVEEVASLMRIRADGKGLQLAVHFEGAIPETILTDPLRLRQILINLVGNAIKFTEVGGVRVVTRLIDAAAGEAKLSFHVIDTGIGLAENQLDVLFQPFTQIDGSMQRKFGGSGLGLAISKRLAEMLGGSITVTSTPGKGSTFTATVATGPLGGVGSAGRDAPAPSPPPQATLSDVRLTCRALLVEDGPDNQRLISFLLRKAGAEVTVADHGQAALDCALAAQREGKPFDVILMDMQMPVMDGYQATARLRQAGFSTPIIALTAHAMTEDRQKCLDAGCDDYLSKPIIATELAAFVAARLRRNNDTVADSPQARP